MHGHRTDLSSYNYPTQENERNIIVMGIAYYYF